MPLNRLVALLTPLVFAPLAGVAAAWLAKHFPGVQVSQDDLQEIFVGGALIALAPAAQWLHGWQKHEARQAAAEHEIELARAAAAGGDEEDHPAEAESELDDLSLEELLALDDEPAATGGDV
jgi:hypothetical protein